MKVKVYEHAGCFSIELKAVSMQEAAMLTRFGVNRTTKVRNAVTYVSVNDQFDTYIVFAKHRKASGAIIPRGSGRTT